MAFNPLKAIGKVFNDFPIIGDAIGAAVDIFGQSSANKQNKKMAREQMAFQERMSSTEMQRRTQDLLASGLNPMLAISQGGASSASGASARMESVTGKAVSSALAMRMQRAQLDNMELQNRLLSSQRGNVEADTNLKHVSAGQVAASEQQIDANIQKIAYEVKNLFKEGLLRDADLQARNLTNRQLEALQPLLLEYQRIINEGEKLGLTRKRIEEKIEAE